MNLPRTAEENPHADNAARNMNIDSRALRSREALCEGFLRLLESHSLEEISVRHIAAEAGVGHATFYRHYGSKEELLEDLAAEEMGRLVDLAFPLLDREGAYASCLVLCEYVHSRRSLWSTLLTGGAALAMKDKLLSIARALAGEFPRSDTLLPTDLSITLAASSLIELLAWWLRQSKPLPAPKVAQMLEVAVIEPQLRQG